MGVLLQPQRVSASLLPAGSLLHLLLLLYLQVHLSPLGTLELQSIQTQESVIVQNCSSTWPPGTKDTGHGGLNSDCFHSPPHVVCESLLVLSKLIKLSEQFDWSLFHFES